MLKCKLCSNKRHSKHWKCLYCKECAEKKKLADIHKSHTVWTRKNKAHLKKYRQTNYHRYKDNRNAKQRQDSAELNDAYIRHVLCAQSTLLKADLTQELIDMKRLELQLNRKRRQ